jgi:hypothetical protein
MYLYTHPHTYTRTRARTGREREREGGREGERDRERDIRRVLTQCGTPNVETTQRAVWNVRAISTKKIKSLTASVKTNTTSQVSRDRLMLAGQVPSGK